jgi:hypothetical protein
LAYLHTADSDAVLSAWVGGRMRYRLPLKYSARAKVSAGDKGTLRLYLLRNHLTPRRPATREQRIDLDRVQAMAAFTIKDGYGAALVAEDGTAGETRWGSSETLDELVGPPGEHEYLIMHPRN